MRFTIAITVCLLPLAFATSELVVHETREEPLVNPINRKRIESDALLPMRISLRQNQDALSKAEEWLMDVSDPTSANFGRHWSQKNVIEAFQPSNESLTAVLAWLAEHGIEEVTHTDNKQWLAFDLRASDAERLLHTEYFEHFNEKTGRFEASCDQYSIPTALREHLDFIMPAVKAKDVTGRSVRSIQHVDKRRLHQRAAKLGHSQSKSSVSSLLQSSPTSPTVPYKTGPLHSAPPCAPNDLDCCNRSVSPACLRHLYNFTVADGHVSLKNHMGIFEDFPTTLQRDLNVFFEYYTSIPAGTAPVYDAIDGAITRLAQVRAWRKKFLSSAGLFEAITESTLDLQASFPIVYPQNITVFQENDPYWSKYEFTHSRAGLFNSFFDAVDGSDCSFRAFNITGSDPKLDPVYPDPRAHGYKGKLQCGVFKPTNVISLSYGNFELDISFNYQKRQCLEFLKLALQGVSIFVSSGDYGVGPCTRPPKTGLFAPIEPNGCPWLTVVGQTQISKNRTVFQPEVAAPLSGGGFSNIFPRPAYQAAAVTDYFKKHDPGIAYYSNGRFRNGKGRYNRNGRGYPDISANGVDVATIINTNYVGGTGTSLSAPIAASLFNRIIEERIRVGKGPLGFVNPTLYKHPEAPE